ncbi:hypothetical protein Q1695_015163 [Nippostrongylus brasiliensis]|nr:hypothetical protein Q1695_015163 [Nippostrongylus brasiliensis]
MISRIPLDSLKWWASVIGWLAALASWFQIIIVLGLGRMEILSHQWKFFVFVGLWIIITCSYFNAVFTTAQPIPKEYHIEETDDEGVRNLEIRQKGGKLNIFSVNYCQSCRLLKPLRTHHCKVCNRCILRMDHHCPLLQVCIHHHNHKFFLLFLLWPCCLGVFVTLITIPYTLRTAANLWMGGTLSSEHHLLNSAIMNAVVIALSVGSLLKTQLQSLLANRTTIEDSQLSFLDEDEMSHEFSVFDLGSRLKNFRSIFGHSPLTWFMPTYTTPGDGVNYPYVVRRGSDIDGAGSPTPKKRFWEFW